MMKYILGRASLAVCVLALLLGAIRMAQADNDVPQGALRSIRPGNCEMPCWTAIRPGVTTMTEAVRLLLADPEVDPASLHPLCEGCISLTARWKAAQGVLIRGSADPAGWDVLIESRWNADLVQSVVVRASVPSGDFVAYFGVPERTTAGVLPDGNLYLIFGYPALGMYYNLFAPCRRTQNLLKLSGNFYVLQAAQSYTPPYGLRDRETWRRFGNSDLDRLAEDAGSK